MSPFLLFLLLIGCLSFFLLRRSSRAPSLPPGPRGLPIVGCIPLIGPRPHRALHRLAAKYGPFMHLRMGAIPTIVVSDASTAEQFLKAHDIPFANRPPLEIFACISYGLKGFAFAEHGPYWRHIRKLCVSHLLSAAKIASFRSARREELALFVGALSAAADSRTPVNLSSALSGVVSDVVCRMIMGRKFSTDDKDGEMFRAKTRELMGLIGAFNINDFVPVLSVFDLQRIRKRMKAVHEEFDALLEKIIDEHSKKAAGGSESEEKDFVDTMLSLMETEGEVDGMRFDRSTVKAILLDMLEASMDTMRTPIEWAISELIRHSNVMNRAQQELETIVGCHRTVEEPDLARLDYLHLVFKETLRLHPLSAFLFHHGKEERVVGGYRIPKGSNVMISLWALGRDPAVWREPEEFRPERFLVDGDVDYRNDFRLLSFGAGRRMCAGMQLALTLCPLVLAQLVHCFDWELPKGVTASDLNMNESYGFTMPRTEHLWAIPKTRLDECNLRCDHV